MRAVLLAAGVGRRLAPLGHAGPKCLLSFGGRSLLRRHVESLHELGVTDLVVTVGFRAGEIEAELDSLRGLPRPRTVLNPQFERGSVVSLWSAREALQAGGDVLLMDADVLYAPTILERLTRRQGNVFLLDRDFDDAGQEAVKLCVRQGTLVEFRKKLDPDLRFDYAGESVGFFRFSEALAGALAERSGIYVRSGRVDEPYEEVIRELLLEEPGRFCAEDVTGLPWIEIDFPADVERACKDVLPRLTAHSVIGNAQ